MPFFDFILDQLHPHPPRSLNLESVYMPLKVPYYADRPTGRLRLLAYPTQTKVTAKQIFKVLYGFQVELKVVANIEQI